MDLQSFNSTNSTMSPIDQDSKTSFMDQITAFFQGIYDILLNKNEQGLYNSICLGVLLALPLLVLLICSIICCHACCCRTRKSNSVKPQPAKKKKKKSEEEDLWIPTPQAKSIMLEKVPSFSV